MERIFDIGYPVIFVDSHGRNLPALITAIHGDEWEVDGVKQYPCINVVFCSCDDTKRDPYGRQIERATSVVHKRHNTAHGYYWRWADEEPNPIANTRA